MGAIVETIDDILGLKEAIQGKFNDLHSDIREDERFYNLEIGEMLNLPRKFRKDGTVLPTAREVVDTAADHIAPSNRRVTVPRKHTNAKGTEQSNKLRRFYEALLKALDTEGYTSKLRDGGKNLGLHGQGVWKLFFDHSKWPKRPVKRSSETDEEFIEREEDWKIDRANTIPLTLKIIHPTEVIFDPVNEPPHWVMEFSKKFVYEVKQEFPSWPNSKNLKQYDEVEVLEYWENKKRAIIINKESALKGGDIIRNRIGVHPYIIGASGMGHDDHDHRLSKKFVGILRFIRGVLLSESRAFSIADIVLKGGAWPVRVAEGDRANEMPRIRLEYGTVQPLPPGVKITDLTPQLPPNMVFDFMQLNNGIISAASAPRVVRGLSSPGTNSGFDRQLELGQARLRYASLAWGMEKMLTETCKKANRILQVMKLGPISIQGSTAEDEFTTITAADFRANQAVEVKINVLEPEDEIRKHQDAATLVTSGLMSPQTAIRTYFPNVDPNTEMGRILAAKLLFSDPILSVIGQSALSKVSDKLGLEEILSQFVEQLEPGSAATRRAPNNPSEGAPVKGSKADQADGRELDLRETGS